METTELSRRVFESLGASDSPEVFEENLAARNVELEWSPNRTGVKFRPIGSTTWLKGSSTSRDLSASKILWALARNAELRREARQAGESAAAAAGVRAHARAESVLTRVDGAVPAPEKENSRALLPDAAAAEAAAMRYQESKGDGLDFLALPPITTKSAGRPLDDAGLLPPASDEAEALARHKKTKKEQEERDRDQAMLDVQAEIRKLSVKQLLDLKSNVPPFVLTAAAIEALVNLMIRLFTLGLVRRVDNLSDALAARQELQQYAEAELDRRRRSPASVVDRKAALNEYAAAVQERSNALDKRYSVQQMSNMHRDRAGAAVLLRRQLEAGFDRLQTSRGHETIKKRRAEHQAAVAAHRAVRDSDKDLVPAGFGGLFITRAQRDAAAVEKASASLKLKRAAELRESTKALLNLFLNEVEEVALKHEKEEADALKVIKNAEALERHLISLQLRDLPDQLRQVSAAAQRAQHQERGVEIVAEHNRPKTLAELAEVERQRQLGLADRRG